MYAQLEDAGLIIGTEEWKEKQEEKYGYLFRIVKYFYLQEGAFLGHECREST